MTTRPSHHHKTGDITSGSASGYARRISIRTTPLFGGCLLRWIDEEAAIPAILELGKGPVVTEYLSKINFVSSAGQAI